MAEAPAKKPNALQQPLQPSPELAAVVGSAKLARGAVVSKMWEYIKKNNLLWIPQNKRRDPGRRHVEADLRRQGRRLDVRDEQAPRQAPEVGRTFALAPMCAGAIGLPIRRLLRCRADGCSSAAACVNGDKASAAALAAVADPVGPVVQGHSAIAFGLGARSLSSSSSRPGRSCGGWPVRRCFSTRPGSPTADRGLQGRICRSWLVSPEISSRLTRIQHRARAGDVHKRARSAAVPLRPDQLYREAEGGCGLGFGEDRRVLALGL